MQIAFTDLKLLIVLIFLVKFLRRPSVVWGIGLLTVTTAVLLDTLLGTFDRDALLGELGFFFYIIAGRWPGRQRGSGRGGRGCWAARDRDSLLS
jgi:hypothetical protein